MRTARSKPKPTVPDGDARFRELMIQLTGDLDLGQALRNSFLPMRAVIPLDELILIRFAYEDGVIKGMHVVIRATEHGLIGKPDDLLREFSEEEQAQIGGPTFKQPNYPSVLNGLPSELSPAAQAKTFALLGLPPHASALVVIHNRGLGGLLHISYQPHAYDQRHVQLLESVKDIISIAITNAVQHLELRQSKEDLAEDHRQLLAELQPNTQVVGAARGLRRVMELAHQVAPNQTPVLLLGETGVGKEVVAQAIHRASERSGGPLISVNCGAIPESLVDSELFGHEKGAFTGALTTGRGRFERAHGGTLFLDEIGELPLSAQVRLLRVLQTREFERVGGTQPLRTDVRLVAATHRDLGQMVAQGQFREDLLFRLNVFPISIPPLRERRQDIPLLAYHFIEAKSRELSLGRRPVLLDADLQQLVAYDWPGNVRELQNAIERAIILCRGEPLAFPFLSAGGGARGDRTTSLAGAAPAAPFPTFDDASRTYLREALERAGGWVSGPGGAAELAGLNPSTFRSKLKKLGVDAPSPHRRPRRP